MSKSFGDTDLAIFGQGVLPDVSVLTTVTYRSPTSPAWLIDSIAKRILKQGGSVVLASFVNKTEGHAKAIKRPDVPIERLKLLDLSSKLFTHSRSGFAGVKPDTLLSEIEQAVKSLGNCSIIIEDMDVAIGSGIWSAQEARAFAVDAHRLATASMFITCHLDSEMISSNSPLADEHYNLSSALLHLSSCVIDMRPLPTGRARDVTGVLRISRGPRFFPTSNVAEAEYLYYVGDTAKYGEAKLFHR